MEETRFLTVEEKELLDDLLKGDTKALEELTWNTFSFLELIRERIIYFNNEYTLSISKVFKSADGRYFTLVYDNNIQTYDLDELLFYEVEPVESQTIIYLPKEN